MKRVIAIVVALVLFSVSAGADELPAESNESLTRSEETPSSPDGEPVNTDEPEAEGSESPAGEEAEVTSPAGAPTDAGEPTAEGSENPEGAEETVSTRPDFAALQKHLVVVKDGMESDARQSPGFSISAQGHIVTYVGELQDNPSYLVSTATGQVFPATKIEADEQTGVWILQLSDSGHGLTGLPFARTALQAVAPLYAVNFNPSDPERFTPVAGSVTQLVDTEQGQMIQHNALFSLTSAGTPLLNRCYQAVGVNVLQKHGRLFQREVDPTEQGSAQSLTAASLAHLLASLNLSLPVADTECLSLEEETQQKIEQARQEQVAALQRQREQAAAEQQAELQRQQEEAHHQEEALRREKEAAQEQARRATAQTEAERQRAAQERQEQQAELQRQQDEAQRREAVLQQEKEEAAQRQRQIVLYGAVIGGLVLLGVIVLIRRKQKRLRTTEQEKQNIAGALDRAQSELSQAAEQDRLRGSVPDVFLEGTTPPIALKIPGASLVERTGAVVGRSPAASTFVINHEQVSRQHFRLSLVAQQVMLEDLGSTNGTSVDGVAVETGRPTPVRDGSRLGLGDLELTLHIGG